MIVNQRFSNVNCGLNRQCKGLSAATRRICKLNASSSRSVVMLPGLGNNSQDYDQLKMDLESRGLSVGVVQIKRIDWMRNVAGVFDSNYWSGTLQPRPFVDWYLNKIDDAIQQLVEDTGGAPVTMVAHSAGGWLGRLYLRDFNRKHIDRFVSLGSPHHPPPLDRPGVVDQTRGILTYCSEFCPGSYHGDIDYVTIAGHYIRGAELNSKHPLRSKLTGVGYQQVCGDADVWGDGIVPVHAAHLDGATQVNLAGVYHSPIGAQQQNREAEDAGQKEVFGEAGTEHEWRVLSADADASEYVNGMVGRDSNSYDEEENVLWYGSKEVVDLWYHHITGDILMKDSEAVQEAASVAKQ